jgi:hypothetical protein
MKPHFEKLFLGAGAMKAGTTWLYKLLSRHPDIYFTPEKEIHYFAQLHSDERPLSLDRRLSHFKRFAANLKAEDYNFRWTKRRMDWFDRWIREPLDDKWYAGLFKGIRPGQYAADFSNLTCLIDDEGWTHVKSITPHLRVLYIIRHPLERLWSHVKFHLQFTGRADELLRWSPADLEAFARERFIWQNGEYGQIVSRLKLNLRPDQLMISFFEDIHQEPVSWIHELCRFLQIPTAEQDRGETSKPVNTTVKSQPPDALHTLFENDFNRISSELRSLGLKLPPSYNSPHRPDHALRSEVPPTSGDKRSSS